VVVVAEMVVLVLVKTLPWLAYRRRHLGWQAQGAVMRWETGIPRRRRGTNGSAGRSPSGTACVDISARRRGAGQSTGGDG
jgi:hypothetical protein